MKTFIGATAAATALLAGAAYADGPSITGNVALTSDYAFRGISQTDGDPALQGGFDYTNETSGIPIYAGVWGSSIDFAAQSAELELDVYAGLKPRLNDQVGFDLGVIGYLYPSASDDGAELDYIEAYAKVGIDVTPQFAVGGAIYLSPEFTGETGNGLYAEASAGYKFNDAFAASGAFGMQQADDADFDVGAGIDDNYNTWNAGVTWSPQGDVLAGFSFDARYMSTDIDNVDAADDRAVFTIKRAM
ncbi:MAG: hypothetical protein IV086_07430 [Hyphomonadaceae bacterium]|nr:MAG: hypothetical protein FD160_1861 [Caulobacteraceae bacterium]MBT9445511.1 hypothetical protein [Hyphomonadaceae bacterium]TPW04199.1 MAG: hypothetical protein FD124_2717 [Alphaproteobacteria bacterium]